MKLNRQSSKIGIGIYSASEIADILCISYPKVYKWMDSYWDKKLATLYNKKYSWKTEGKRSVSFHTFIEFYVMMRFSEAGVKPKAVLEAHKELSEMFETTFPFANKQVLESIKTDGKNIFFEIEGVNLSLNGTKQLNLDVIKMFFVNLDFDKNNVATKYYPLGKEKSIVVDPNRKFGHPLLEGNNIQPQILYNHYKSGDPIEYLASIYEIGVNVVNDAIEYCSKRAA